MKLLTLRQYGLRQRYPHRSANIPRDVDGRRGLVDLVRRHTVVGGRRDRKKEERKPRGEEDA